MFIKIMLERRLEEKLIFLLEMACQLMTNQQNFLEESAKA